MEEALEGGRYTPRLVGLAHIHQDVLKESLVVATSSSAGTEAEVIVDGNSTASSADSNCFKSAQWSPDGATVITSSADNTLRSFVLPTDLLTASLPHYLEPYATHRTPEPTYATVIHPLYTLQSPSTALFLTSPRTLPIRLLSPFTPSILATYPLVSPTTEEYIAPHSLLFSSDNANHFFAGSESLISIFDINRNGEGPMSRMPTIASRRNRVVGGGGGMKGIISALAMSGDGLLAAGTFSRWVGLYDAHGRGDTVGVFEAKGDDGGGGGGGRGITQVLWSICGRYLCLVERGSDGIAVWDVRGSGRRLAWLGGRCAMTNQRLGVAVIGGEVWAGGTDGIVRVWEGLGMREGVVNPDWEFRGHEDAISSTILHPSGLVLATCSGSRYVSLGIGLEADLGSNCVSADESILSPTHSTSTSGGAPERITDSSLKFWALSM